jgi:hypothetical protein
LRLTLEEVTLKIRKRKTEKKILTIINTLFSTIKEVYKAILERCEDKEEASRTLQIIVVAKRLLTIGKLNIVLELKLDTTVYKDLNC